MSNQERNLEGLNEVQNAADREWRPIGNSRPPRRSRSAFVFQCIGVIAVALMGLSFLNGFVQGCNEGRARQEQAQQQQQDGDPSRMTMDEFLNQTGRGAPTNEAARDILRRHRSGEARRVNRGW